MQAHIAFHDIVRGDAYARFEVTGKDDPAILQMVTEIEDQHGIIDNVDFVDGTPAAMPAWYELPPSLQAGF